MKNINGYKLGIPIHADKEGYIDKECPSKACQFTFKVYEEDWKNIFKDEAVYCPLCGHKAKADSWWTTEQVEHSKKQAMRYVRGRIGRAMEADARAYCRKQPRNSFIKMSMKTSGFNRNTMILPAKAKELFERKLTCEKCNARYSVIGSAYFCPSCGHNSVEQTFNDSLKKIISKIDNKDTIRKAFAEIGKKDDAEITIRSLIESALSDGVTAFQRLAEELHSQLPGASKTPFNVFQRIDDGSVLWKRATGKGYDTWLTAPELDELKLLFQKRHLLAHKEGMVDDKYIMKSGDTTYKVGQRLVIRDSDVRRLVTLISKLADGMKKAI